MVPRLSTFRYEYVRCCESPQVWRTVCVCVYVCVSDTICLSDAGAVSQCRCVNESLFECRRLCLYVWVSYTESVKESDSVCMFDHRVFICVCLFSVSLWAQSEHLCMSMSNFVCVCACVLKEMWGGLSLYLDKRSDRMLRSGQNPIVFQVYYNGVYF